MIRSIGVALLLGPLGCKAVRAPMGLVKNGAEEKLLTDLQLRSKLEEFVDNFSVGIQGASDTIVQRSTDLSVRRDAVLLKARTIPLTRRIVLEKTPKEAFLDLWAFSLQLHHFLLESGTDRFGGNVEIFSEIFSEVCNSNIAHIESIGASLLDEDGLATAKAEIESFARANPIGQSLTRQAQLPSSVDEDGSSLFGWVDSIPLVGSFEGLDEGARAVNNVAEAGNKFTRVASTLPEETRWQLELLAYDIEGRETLVTTRAGIQALATSSTKLAETAAGLPDEVRGILDESFDRIESEREGLTDSLHELRQGVADVDAALLRGETIASSFERTAESLARAGVALEGMAHAFTDPSGDASEEPSPESEGDGFDVEEYGRSADSLQKAAAEIRALVEETRALAAGEELDGTLESTREHAASLVDLIAWRAIQVVAASLVLLLVYRILARRLAPADDPGSPA